MHEVYNIRVCEYTSLQNPVVIGGLDFHVETDSVPLRGNIIEGDYCRTIGYLAEFAASLINVSLFQLRIECLKLAYNYLITQAHTQTVEYVGLGKSQE